jgi:hypothetical protein
VALSRGGVGVECTTGQGNGKALWASTGGDHTQIAVDALAVENAGQGIAVRAETKHGIAILGLATGGGYALDVHGRAVFDRSGKTTITAGQSTKTLSGHAITSATVVVATVQGNPPGIWVRSVSLNDANDTFTIRLNKAAPSGGVVVGYFLVN